MSILFSIVSETFVNPVYRYRKLSGWKNFIVIVKSEDRKIIINFDTTKEDIHYLKDAASFLVRRNIDIEQTMDGKFIVLYMNHNEPPPPKGDTALEALKLFLAVQMTKDMIPVI